MQYIQKSKKVQCPYCWESINVLIDCSLETQAYIEDCQVCCKPIIFEVNIVEEEPLIVLKTEDE